MPTRRVIRLTAGAAPLLFAVALAAQPAQTARPAPDAGRIDPKAIAILEAMDDAFRQAEGLVATYVSETPSPPGRPPRTETTALRLGRPNVYELRTSMAGGRERILASDGKTRFDIMTGTPARCTTSDVAPQNESREITTFNPVYWGFYDLGEWQIRSALLGQWSTKWRLGDPGFRSVRYVGRGTAAGVPVDIVEWQYTIGYNRPEDDPVFTSTLSIGLDRFVRHIETTSVGGRGTLWQPLVETVTDIRTIPRPALAEFAVTVPAGATCARVNPEDVYTTGQYADLPVGSTAPDFTLGTARGETLRFSTFFKQHKVVLMNYWGYG